MSTFCCKQFNKILFALFFFSILFSSCTKLSDERTLDSDSSDAQELSGKLASALNSTDLSSTTISASDSPYGYALVNSSSSFGGYSGSLSGTTVTTRAELISAVSKGGIIYVKGEIDMTNVNDAGTMIPTEAGGSTTALDSFVTSVSSTSTTYSDYSAWKNAYVAACSVSTDDSSSSSTEKSSLYSDLWILSNAYKAVIQLNLKSDTTLIGINQDDGSASIIKGANISIYGVSNIAIRNLVIQDSFDPFPHHEADDGYNAQWDCITVQGVNSNIWVDHCTFKDSLTLAHVYTSGTVSESNYEKWQVYDGLFDIKGKSTYITISHNRFMNHDKTMLIGSSNSETVTVNSSKVSVAATDRYITIDHNLYYNCGQRLPMVRLTSMVITNNYYEYSNGYYTQQYAIGPRYGSLLIIKGNYFGYGINYTLKDDENATNASVYFAENTENSNYCTTNTSKNGMSNASLSTSTMPFTPADKAFNYTLEDADDLPDTICSVTGAGCSVTIE